MRYPIIDLGAFPIYKFMGGLGFILGLLLLINNLKTYKIREEKKDLLLFLLAVSCLVGMASANVGNWLVMPELLQEDIINRIGKAGFSYYFGFIGFLIVSSSLLKIFGFQAGKCLNYFIPSLLLFHSLGRVGCSLAGCCYGRLVNWELFNLFTVTRFPAREIEAFSLFVLFLIVQFIVKKNRLIFYFLTYPIIRFLLEFGRGDYRGLIFMGWLSIAQLISVIIICSTIVYILIAKIRGRNLAFLAGSKASNPYSGSQ